MTEGMEWGGTSEKRCEWMVGKDEEVEMGERGRGRIKRDRGDYLLPLLNFNSLMTSGCFFNQMISSSSNSSSWFPYISPTPERSQSRFTLKAEDMLLMSRFDGDILPLSIKLISCFEHPTDDANFSMLRFFSFLTCLILTFIFSLSTGKERISHCAFACPKPGFVHRECRAYSIDGIFRYTATSCFNKRNQTTGFINSLCKLSLREPKMLPYLFYPIFHFPLNTKTV